MKHFRRGHLIAVFVLILFPAAASAQVSDDRLNAILEPLAATCFSEPPSCSAVMEAAIAEIQAIGGSPADINRQVGAVVSRVTQVYELKRETGILTEEAQGALSGAIIVAGNSFVENPDDPEEFERLQNAALTLATNVTVGADVVDVIRTLAVSGTAS